MMGVWTYTFFNLIKFCDEQNFLNYYLLFIHLIKQYIHADGFFNVLFNARQAEPV